MNDVKELVRIAQSDADASAILCKARLFPQAYFFFQQAVEKSNKAIALISGLFQPSDLQGVSHDQIKIFKKGITEQQVKMREHEELMKLNEPISMHDFYRSIPMMAYGDTLNHANKTFDSLRNVDLIRIDLNVVDSFIDQIEIIRDVDISLQDIDGDALQKYVEQIANWLGVLGTRVAGEQKSEILKLLADRNSREQITIAVKGLMRTTMDIAFINLVLYFGAILTIQHSSRTRYIKDDQSPLELYTSDLPIIQRLPKLLALLNAALSKLSVLPGVMSSQPPQYDESGVSCL